MRVRLLRADDDGTVLLVYPSTMDEYGQAQETLGGAAGATGAGGPDAGRAEGGPAQVSCVVTTAA